MSATARDSAPRPVSRSLRARADLTQTLRVLDVGSNRGSFARAFLAEAPARPPHLRRTGRARRRLVCAHRTRRKRVRAHRRHELSRRELRRHPFLPHDRTSDAARTQCWPSIGATLKPGGLLLVDAPNIALIGIRRHRRGMVHRQASLPFLRPHAVAPAPCERFRDHRRTRSGGSRESAVRRAQARCGRAPDRARTARGRPCARR